MPLCRYPLTLRLRYSRVRGRRQSKFLASSSTGGARNFYPEGGINAPPEAVCFLMSTASLTGSRAVFQYAAGALPREALARRIRLLFKCRGARCKPAPAAMPREKLRPTPPSAHRRPDGQKMPAKAGIFSAFVTLSSTLRPGGCPPEQFPWLSARRGCGRPPPSFFPFLPAGAPQSWLQPHRQGFPSCGYKEFPERR